MITLGMFATFCTTEAKVTLPALFTDNMVLQQKSDIILRGHSTNRKEVMVITGCCVSGIASFFRGDSYSGCSGDLRETDGSGASGCGESLCTAERGARSYVADAGNSRERKL